MRKYNPNKLSGTPKLFSKLDIHFSAALSYENTNTNAVCVCVLNLCISHKNTNFRHHNHQELISQDWYQL